MRVPILRREQRLGGTWRILECGHELKEGTGGKAGTAIWAWCRLCFGAKAKAEAQSKVVGTCTARVLPANERTVRACGQPARHLRDGKPRCAKHNRSPSV